MEMGPAYDMAITVFSPDGRLFQVQYAQEAVKRGTPAVGMEYDNGVLILASKTLSSKLTVSESVRKIFKIDDHIGAAISGLVADARRLIMEARVNAQRNRYLYNEPIPVDAVTKELCDLKQLYTQYAGARPFGASLLIAGLDSKGKHLFETDPSGAFTEYSAKAIGANANEADVILDKKYKSSLSLTSAISLGISALNEVSEQKLKPEQIDGAYIGTETGKFTVIPDETVKKYLLKE